MEDIVPIYTFEALEAQEQAREAAKNAADREAQICLATIHYIKGDYDLQDEAILDSLDLSYDLTEIELFCKSVYDGEEDANKKAIKKIANYLYERGY